jgi:molecular chaperone HtpG
VNEQSHPLIVHLQQILPLLAKEIYSTPLAFLRENVQNAFDAVRLQRYRERIANISGSQHKIEVIITTTTETEIAFKDTGIGMTAADMKLFYWSLGATGKATQEAKDAGVVGTFGIGGMANFGVANELQLISRTDNNSPAIISSVQRDKLSTSEDCIFYSQDNTPGPRGTTVAAKLSQALPPDTARPYLHSIVRFVDIPVYINGERISEEEPPWENLERYHEGHQHSTTFGGSAGNISLEGNISADLAGRPTLTFNQVNIGGKLVRCSGVLQTRAEPLSTYRYGFKLADVGVSSIYGLSGHINSAVLRPTAGRDTLDSESMGLLQRFVEIVEKAITEFLCSTPALVDANVSLFRYVLSRGRYDLLQLATVRTYGLQERTPLGDIREFSRSNEVFYAAGQDPAIMEVLSKQGKIVVLLSTDNYRRKCEEGFLKRFCSAKGLDVDITATREIPESELSEKEHGFISGIEAILRVRYLIDSARVRPVELTRNAVVWVPSGKTTPSLLIWIDMRHPTIRKLIDYKGSRGYGALIDLFVRDYVFPLIKNAIPSITSDGFEVLLKQLQSRMEIMRIDLDDIRAMQDFGAQAPEGETQRVTVSSTTVASEISIRRADVFNANQIQARASAQGIDVAKEIVFPEANTPQQVQSMKHALAQLEIPEKILDFTALEHELSPWMSGFYIGLTQDAYSYYKAAIERLPRLEFVWGGYRGSYLFFERAEAVLYYDIEFSTLLRLERGNLAATGAITTMREPLFAKDNIFLPIPSEFVAYFVPTTDPIRLVVRHEMLTPETQSTLVE